MIISLDDDLHQIFKELSEVSGISVATLVYQFFDQIREHLKSLRKAMEVFK